MGMCKDPRLTYLNDKGYNVVRLPRKGIVPLGVIGRDRGSMNWLGTLDQIWRSEVPMPKPGDPQLTAGISGKASSDIKLSVNATNSDSTEATYEGTEYLTFGFQVFGLGLMNGDWKAYGVVPGAGTSFAIGEDLGNPIVNEGELVDLDFPAPTACSVLVAAQT